MGFMVVGGYLNLYRDAGFAITFPYLLATVASLWIINQLFSAPNRPTKLWIAQAAVIALMIPVFVATLRKLRAAGKDFPNESGHQ
ncbi:MAG: hypothetical protein ACRDIU_10245 [Actinomycetota bacterium]